MSELLTGHILIAQPSLDDGFFVRSIILIAQHSITGSWGILLNRVTNSITIKDVMNAANIDYTNDEKVYIGGPLEQSRVQIVHSLDWFGPNTLRITDQIGITGDATILRDIANGVGPQHYRIGVGVSAWNTGQLECERRGDQPWSKKHRWMNLPATIDLCFNATGSQQWHNAVNTYIDQQVNVLF